jgi:tripartite-type tricarboxylate transporter receptor subunit TctC
MVESGVTGFVVSSGFGLLAPAGTPRPAIDRVHGALVKAINEPSVRSNLSSQGADPVGNTPEAYEAFNKAEIAKWIKVAKEAGIQPE